MASARTKTFNVSSAGFPGDAASLIIDMLRGKAAFDKWKAAHAALELVTYLMSLAADTYSSKALKAPKVSKKVIADTLERAISKKAGTVKASSFEIPAWLLPVVINLMLKWIENNYPSKSDKK